jgi:eukaryotic-like serine/threonine-protein kinase
MSPRISSNGRAVFSSDIRNTRLWGLDLSNPANEEKELAHNFMMGTGHYRNPSAFTASPHLLAFTSWRTGGLEIWLRDRTAGKEWVLANEPGQVADPILSMSGKAIAYRVQEQGNWAIYAGDPQQGGVRKRICSGCGTPSAWLPGDKEILVNDNGTLMVLNSETGTRAEWVRIPDVVSYFPSVSPVGPSLALVTRSPNRGSWRLYVARLEGGRPVDYGEWATLRGNVAPEGAPVWSKSGDRLYFFDESDGRRCLWSSYWDGSRLHEPKVLRHFHNHSRYPWNSWLARSGDLLVFTLTESTSSMWALELSGSVP